MADTRELIAFNKTEEDVAKHVGADAVIYQALPDLVKSCADLCPEIKTFEVGVFNGQYITPVADTYFKHLESVRGENSLKKRQEAAITAITAGVASEGDVEHVLARVQTNGSDLEKKVKDRMDPSMHNFGDYA